jgi:magnesium chelatase family protein
MISAVRSATLDGVSARPVWVEVDIHRGLPGFAIVGLPDAAVREARERVRAALVNCGFEFPLQRVVVNLAPASLRKAGPGLDLAIAAALLLASAQLRWEGMERVAVVGELALDGALRTVDGALAIAEAAREHGAETVVVPAGNGPEAALADGIEVVATASLATLPALAKGRRPRPPRPPALPSGPAPDDPDLADLRGQPQLRRALEVAAAGAHSLLMVGPPGAGKSLAAVRLPSILPPPDAEEALEVARIAGATGRFGALRPRVRPLRAPHHTISVAGLLGGGTPPRAGEVTLGHRGVLFLDELGEFRREALEGLRAPLGSGEVMITRGARTVRMPSCFHLVAASNPCPCGRGEDDPDCVCAPPAIERFRSRVGGALADQIHIRVGVSQPSAEEIGGPPGEPSAAVRERVCAARERQEARLGPGRCNAEMSPAEVRGCAIDPAAASLLADLYARGRAHDRAMRLACTVADLAGTARIGEEEMAEALQLTRRENV